MAIKRNQKLRDTDEDQIGVSVPKPLNARLNALVDAANEAGESTSRKELVAALILSASAKGPALARAIRSYRSATSADAVLPGDDESMYLDPAIPKPGPRARRRS